MSNIDLKTFARFNSAADRRSDKWVQSYFFLKLTQLKGLPGVDPDSEYFRANKVDNNNPVRDWYRTLRTSNFERDLAKQGIVFANREASTASRQKFTFAVLQVDGKDIAGLSAKDVRNGDLVTKLRTEPDFVKAKLAEIDLTKPGANKEARQKIKHVVNAYAQTENVLKRRQVRKDIQNLTGVRDWRFFEKTRDRVANKKIDIRNKIVTKAIPESTMAGKFIRCLFGITSCRFSEDTGDPQYKVEDSLAGDSNPNKPNDPVQTKDENGKIVAKQLVDLGPAADVVKQIMNKANIALGELNLISTLDSLGRVDQAIHSGELSKGVAVAKGVQAMGLYQVFETSRDQIKTGDVTASEVSDFMKVLGPVASSEGWTKVIAGQGDTSQLTQTQASKNYCKPKHQAQLEKNIAQADNEFAYLCPDKQIGGTSNAAHLENAYKSSIGTVLGPILSAYNAPRHAPIIGGVLDWATGVLNTVFSGLSSVLLDVLNVVGLGDNIQHVMQWVVLKVASFLGAGPILSGYESGGQIINWLLQGGAYSAEASARSNGASQTTTESKVEAQLTLADYNAARQKEMPLFERYLSLSNPDSPIAHSALALSQLNLSSASSWLSFGSVFKVFSSAIFSPFSHKSLAAAIDSGYEGANFSGIQTFDFPQACYDRDPLTATPKNGTNIQSVLGADKVPDSDLTWDLVNDSSQWYQYIYDKIGDNPNADTIAMKIYNCNLLDTSVRGGIGHVYGYTKDNGLQESTDLGATQ